VCFSMRVRSVGLGPLGRPEDGTGLLVGWGGAAVIMVNSKSVIVSNASGACFPNRGMLRRVGVDGHNDPILYKSSLTRSGAVVRISGNRFAVCEP
jgi:hypothetical protein